jgi:hypothetical protein
MMSNSEGRLVEQWDRPAWLSGLSNAALLIEFETALDAREERCDAPDLMRRLDVLNDEISRRECSGLLTERDWLISAQKCPRNAPREWQKPFAADENFCHRSTHGRADPFQDRISDKATYL